MNLRKLAEELAGEPSFRAKQVEQLIYRDLISDWGEATTLPQLLIKKLATSCPLAINAKTNFSQDKNTVKALITFDDGEAAETVLMKHRGGRRTVCVSSQIGCPNGCVFCATGKLGLTRNLTREEIVEQVLFFARLLNSDNERVSNIVFMGMGEPMLNYDEVMAAIEILHDQCKLGIGYRHISLSTVGIVEGIDKLTRSEKEINLAISLHAPTDQLREKLIPLNKKYPLAKIIQAADRYVMATKRRVMWEYLLINGVNDSKECAAELARLLTGKLGFVNLIAYNPTGAFRPSSPQRIKAFKDYLQQHGIDTTERFRFGRDVKAACGQLAKEA